MNCPYAHCGGCATWRLSAEELSQRKTERLSVALGYPAEDMEYLVSPKTTHYRARILLRYHPAKNEIGFFAAGSRQLVSIGACLVAEPVLNEVLEWLRNNPLMHHNDERFRVLLQQADPEHATAHVIGSEGHSQAMLRFCEHLASCPLLLAITNPTSKTPPPLPYDTQAGMTFFYTPAEFRQTNPGVNQKIRARIDSWLHGAELVEDYYGGSGNLSLLLSKHSRVRILEHSSAAQPSVLANIRQNNIELNRFSLRQADLHCYQSERGARDAVIVDPPRAGLSQAVLQSLVEFPANRLVYLSCNLASLRRDFELLCTRYRLISLCHADMMPRTDHIESLCLFLRK